jgi:prolyl oligopeptidase
MQDKLIFEDPANPQRFHTVGTTEDEEYAVLSVSDRGKGKDGNGLWALKKRKAVSRLFRKEITDFSYGVIENIGADFLIETNDACAKW